MTTRALVSITLLTFGIGPWVGSAAAHPHRATSYGSSLVVPAGTTINVRLDTKVSTEHARVGDAWNGTITQSVHSGDRVVIPAGSAVSGVVTSSAQGTHNSKARLDLAVRRVTVNGESYSLRADTPQIIAGSKRAKKIGAIAGGTAAGALLGGAAGGKKGAIIGGVLGGAATYGLTRSAFRTLQLKEGTVVTFTTTQDLVARR